MSDIDEVVGKFDVAALQAGLGLAATVADDEKISRMFAGASTALAAGKFLYDNYKSAKNRRVYTIRINETDKLFDVVQKWLINSLPSKDQKSIVVESKRAPSGMDIDMDSYGSRRKATDSEDFLKVYYDGERTQKVRVDNGDTVDVSMSSERSTERTSPNSSKTSPMRAITITCKNIKTRDHIISMLSGESKAAFKRKPTFWVANKWGNFRSESDVPVRPKDTVILRDGQQEMILEEIEEFLRQEDRYVELGLPWHMGILFHGPPGSGKTSIATTIAHTLNLDIHYIALSALEGDDTLIELLGDVSPRSILLLEDIDIAHAAKDRDDAKNGVTLSGLLNGLDGITTPHGIITIMTTNHFEVLDPALVRPGRVDLLQEIGYVDSEQVERICSRFIGFIPENLPTITEEHKIVASEIIEVFKSNLNDNEEAGRMLVKKLTNIVEESDNVSVTKKASKKTANAR